ncbi:hypothetical protein [Kribbella sp. NPDC051620]|uniref:hypothetical protein n=1 Tax=Kribbella sp. NPDC051620 TaxID=3364120 RepID=UPI0037887E4C
MVDGGRWILVFGFGTLLLFGGIYLFIDRRRRDRSKGHFNITFARLFGLITVAVLGGSLAFLGKDEQFTTSAFTLLGTIAGYLAGAKATTGPPVPPDEGGPDKPAAEGFNVEQHL